MASQDAWARPLAKELVDAFRVASLTYVRVEQGSYDPATGDVVERNKLPVQERYSAPTRAKAAAWPAHRSWRCGSTCKASATSGRPLGIAAGVPGQDLEGAADRPETQRRHALRLQAHGEVRVMGKP